MRKKSPSYLYRSKDIGVEFRKEVFVPVTCEVRKKICLKRGIRHVLEILPCPDRDISRIVDQYINSAMYLCRRRYCISNLLLLVGDIELQNRGSCLLQVLNLFNFASCSNDLVPTG